MKTVLDSINDFARDLLENGSVENSIRSIKLDTYTFNKLLLEDGQNPNKGNVVTMSLQTGVIKIRRDVQDEIDVKLRKIEMLQEDVELLKRDL